MPATIFFGTKVKTLKDTLTLNGNVDWVYVTSDPTSVAVNAPQGSIIVFGNKLYRKLSTGSGTDVEEIGAGAGGINYIDNNDAEVNTTGWATFADAAASSPVDGTGGSPSSTFARNTSSPLRGAGDFLFTKGAANRQGEGFSYDFSIDVADKTKVLEVSFDYTTSSGYADDDVGVWLYDVTNSVLIQPSPYLLKGTQASQGKFVSYFQATTSTSYRLIVHVKSTSATAYTINLDNVTVGPAPRQYGPVLGDWKSDLTFSASAGFGSVTSASYRYKRVGDQMVVKYFWLNGTVAASSAYISLPAGYKIDTSKLPAQHTQLGLFYVGNATVNYNTSSNASGVLFYDGSTDDKVYLAVASSSSSVPFNTFNADAQFNSSDANTGEFSIPIVGWGASVSLSTDADTRVVAARYTNGSNQAVANATDTTIKYTTKVYDTHGAYDTGSGAYTVLVPGYYKVVSSILMESGSWSAGEQVIIKLFKNGSEVSRSEVRAQATFTDRFAPSNLVDVVSCASGDTLLIKVYQSSGASLNFESDTVQSFLDIDRISGPAQIAASESVAMSVYSSVNLSITGSSTTTLVFDSVAYDTHGGYNTSTGKYTVRTPGVYLVHCVARFAAASFTAGNANIIYVNGTGGVSSKRMDIQYIHTTATQATMHSSTRAFRCNSGDEIYLQAFHQEGSSRNIEGGADSIEFSVEKVGI